MITSLIRGIQGVRGLGSAVVNYTPKISKKMFSNGVEEPKNSGSSKILLGAGSLAVLGTGIAIGSSDSELLSTLKKIMGLNLKKAGNALAGADEKPSTSPTTTTTSTLPVVTPPVLEKTPPPPSLMTQVMNSPITHIVGCGVTGAALTASGNLPLAIMTFGIMGSKILDISGGYDHLEKKTLSAFGPKHAPKEAEKGN